MKITEQQIKDCYSNPELLKQIFPDVFKNKLEVGKWYKSTDGHSALLRVVEAYKGMNENFAFESYGFNFDGYYVQSSKSGKGFGSHNLTLATKEEVEQALFNEAEKKGFKKGAKFKTIDGSDRICTFNGMFYEFIFNTLHAQINGDEWEKDGKYISSNPEIFNNGKWAEIISEPIVITLDQIAEKFNVDVTNIKIVK